MQNIAHLEIIKGKLMSQIQYETTLLFDLPDDVSPSEQIQYLSNLLTKQPELLLLKVTGISNIGVWGKAE
jgi:hypothetical protein